jgi:hypothetical protein
LAVNPTTLSGTRIPGSFAHKTEWHYAFCTLPSPSRSGKRQKAHKYGGIPAGMLRAADKGTMTTTTYHNPTWWSTDEDSAWERTKAALKRDWDQTKHDFGGNEPDTDQQLGDTVKQAAGKEPIPPRREQTFEDVEEACRFGVGAHTHYGPDYPEWDDELEAILREEWQNTESSRRKSWEEDREAIQYGWDYVPEDEEP